MPLYQITGPDGVLYEIEGPAGASRQQVIAAIQARKAEQEDRALEARLAELRAQKFAPKTTVGGNVKELFKGLIPGAVGLVETAGTGISALLPDDTEKAAREKIKEIAGVVKKPFEAAPGYEDSIGRKLGEGLGSFLPVAPLGLLGATGVATGVGVGLAAGAGEARERAEQGGASADQRSTATALGTVPGAFDTAIDMALAAFPGGAGKAIGFIKRALISGGIEGATEAAQEVAQNAIAKGVYKPDQSLLAGSGESGATGAGVGALASLILDMALPGRRRGATPSTPAPGAAPETTPETTPETQQLLGYTQEPFTPKVMPDGSVITSRADEEAYARDVAQRDQDRRTSDPMANVPSDQRDLARRGKEAALAETFAREPAKGQMDLPGVERADGTVEIPGQGRVTPRAAAAEPTAAEPERDTQTRDMIDELETAQIKEMEEADKSAQLRGLLQEDTAKTERERQKFESDLAELSGRIEAKAEKTTQDRRLEVLLPLIDTNVTNIPQVFARELKREGFANTNLTEREQRLLDAAYNFRVAEKPEPTPPASPEVEPASADNAAMEALIPEKKDTRQPEQPSFPGMGKPKGAAPQAFSEEELARQQEKPFATKLTPEALAATGLPKQSGFFKQLLNIDMANEANWPVMRDVLSRVRANPNVTQNTKDAIERIAMQAFGGLAKQGELFPKGGKPSEPKGGKPSEPKEPKTPKAPKEEKPSGTAGGRGKDAGDVAAGDRTRPSGGEAGGGAKKGDEKPADTKRTEAPKPAGLGDSGKPAGDTGKRKGGESGALKGETKVHPRIAARIDAVEEREEAQEQAEYAKERADMVAEFKAKHDREVKAGWAAAQRARQALKSAGPRSSILANDIERTASALEDAAERYGRWVDEGTVTSKILRDLEQGTLNDIPQLRKDLDAALETLRTGEKVPAKPKTEPKTESKGKAAPKGDLGTYAAMMERDPERAIEDLAHDIYMATYPQRDTARGLNEITAALARGEMPNIKFGKDGGADFYPGTGGKYAKAFYNSLSADQKAKLLKQLDRFFIKEEAITRRGMDWFNARQALDKATQDQADQNPALVREAMRMFMPLHPRVAEALRKGDVAGALTLMAQSMSGRNAAIASALAKALPGVKIQIVDNLKSSSGRDLAGDYDPATNTIRLDSKAGLNVHTVLHEATHAAVLKVLSNKAHPMTKQLTELFSNIKGSLDSAYGATSLDEFVSEVMSNPEFQQKLAQINPKGEAISALRRFLNAVGNLLRRMVGMQPKGLDSAIDAADVLIGNILTPGGSTLGVGTLYQASLLGTAKDVFGAMDNAILRMPGVDNAFVGGIYEVLRDTIPNATKTTILRSLPLNSLTEVATRYIPMAKKLDTLEKEWGGTVDIQRQKVDATYHHIQKWIKGNTEKEAALNRVISASTLAEVDPSSNRDVYKGKKTKAEEDKQAVWDKLQVDWKALGPEGQGIYKQMRDSYTEAHTRLLNMLFKRIDDSVTDPKEAEALRTEIYKRLAVKGKIEPYFPLMRQGDYWVTFNAKGPDGNMEYYKMAFQSSVERALAIRELKADPKVDAKSVEESSPTGKRNYKSAPSTSFVNSILKVLNANSVPDNVTDEIMRVFLDTLPESSFAQSFRTRMGTLGFDTNATKVFYTKSISMAHQLANLEYGAKMYKLRDEMDEHVKSKGNDPAARMVFDTLDRHINTMVSPNIATWSKVATSTAFGFTLGFNVSSALVNFTQLPMVVMPYLGGKYGYPETTKAVGAATRLFLGSGLKRRAKMTGSDQSVELNAGYSLDNYNFDALAEKAKKGTITANEQAILDMRELAEVSSRFGLLSRSVANDTLEMGKDDSVLTRVNNWTGFVFHHGERMNRQIAMMAAYQLELDRMRADKKDLTPEDRQSAAQEAIRLTELLNGGASANSAPLLAKSSLGKVVFMYKRYGVSMYYMMFKTAQEAMKSEDKLVRKAAKRQIAGIYASAALLAGVQGLPMFGIAAVMYNMFKDDDEDDFETAARKYMGEGYFNGALNYLTGTAVANRIGLTDLLLHSTGYRNQDNAVLSFLQLAGGPVYGVADRLVRGGKMVMEGEVQRGLEQVMPAAFGNVMKGYRFGTEGANTLRGDPIVGEVGVGHSLAQAFGFAPAEYTRQLEVNAAEKNTERRVTEERTKLLRQYYVAIRMGDSDGANEAMRKLIEMGTKRPGLVTPETIQRSMAQHMRTTSTMYHGITMNKLMRNELLQDAAEYDKDVTIFQDEGE
jgi:hypothetical protein